MARIPFDRVHIDQPSEPICESLTEFLDKYLGDALYAIMLYVLLGAILVNMRPSYKFFLTLSLMVIIEVFQLSNIPGDFSRSSNILLNIVSTLLGTKFSWLDILAYLIFTTVQKI